MDSSHHFVSSSPVEARKALVGNEKTSGQELSIPTDAIARSNNLDWRAIFTERPELSPPGYEEAARITREKVQQRKLTVQQASRDKMSQKSPPKSKRKR